MFISNCAICGTEKLRFIKNQEASNLLSKLEIIPSLSNITLISDISSQN